MVVTLEKVAHEVVESSLQAKEEVGVRRLGHVGNCAVGQNQVEANSAINRKTVLVGLVGVSCWYPLVNETVEHPQGQTAAKYKAAHAYLLSRRAENTTEETITVLAYPTHAPTNDGNIVALELFMYGVPY